MGKQTNDKLPSQTITNSTGFVIDVVDVYNSAKAKEPPNIVRTSLGKIQPGKTADIQTIHIASHIEVTISGKIPGLGDKEHVNFPIHVIALFSFKAPFKVITIDKSNVDGAVQTFNFVRYVSANPNSTLATQFRKLISDSKSPLKTIESNVDKFFATSKSFNLGTMSVWSAITGWQTAFLSPWQGSFYLYDSSKNVQAITLVAGANITVSSDKNSPPNYIETGTLGLVDDNGNWSKDSQQVEVVMSNGVIQEKNPGEGGISVSLTPVWMNVTQKVGNKMSSLIGPTLSGKINNRDVMGNIQKLTTTGKSDGKNTRRMSPDPWSKIQGIAALLISGGMLFIMFKQWRESQHSKLREKVNDSKDPAQDKRIVEQEEDLKETIDQNVESQITEIQDSLPSLTNQEKELSESLKTEEFNDHATSLEDSLKSLLEEGCGGPDLDAITKQIETAMANSEKDVDSALKTLDEASKETSDVAKTYESKITEELKDSVDKVTEDIKESSEMNEEIDKANEERESTDEKDSSEDFDESDFSEPESEPIEFGGGE